MLVRVQAEDFDPGALLAGFGGTAGETGGIASFIGLVRGDGGLVAMTLEHYPGMTERQLAAIAQQAWQRWPLTDLLLVHRHGRLLPGERIVMTAAASAHRQAAFEACAFLMDWLKTRAPFWKYEEWPTGGRWVEAKASDDQAAERWEAS